MMIITMCSSSPSTILCLHSDGDLSTLEGVWKNGNGKRTADLADAP